MFTYLGLCVIVLGLVPMHMLSDRYRDGLSELGWTCDFSLIGLAKGVLSASTQVHFLDL